MATDPPGLAELEATVRRMEARLAAEGDPAVAALMQHYRSLCARFEADLGQVPRDLALARSSALMLVQAVAQAGATAAPPPAATGTAPQLAIVDGPATDELAEVFAELHRHHVGDLAPDLDTVRANLRDRVLAPGSGTRVLVARSGGPIAGLATFAILYPAPGAQGQLFMKDLYVRAASRGQGVGEALMAFLARHALASGCVRFDWTTERGNPGAIAFYERLGARIVDEKVYFRLDGATLRALGTMLPPSL